MKSIGFAIKKGELWYAVLDGETQSDAQIIVSGKHLYSTTISIPDMMLNFNNLFEEVLTKYTPDAVAYKLHLNSSLTQIPYMHLPFGVLNMLCKQKDINTTLRSGAWITAGKNKKTDQCKSRFNDRTLKNEELAAVLVAWFEYGEQ